VYLKVRVTPDAKVDLIEEVSVDLWRIKVRVPAEHNLANQRVRELVASQKNISVAEVKIISGHHSRSKILALPD
jgi:uncharacterized protein YggU (UPF0235/DUF167 family)